MRLALFLGEAGGFGRAGLASKRRYSAAIRKTRRGRAGYEGSVFPSSPAGPFVMGILLGAAALGASITVALAWLGFRDLTLALMLAPGGASAMVVLAAFSPICARLDKAQDRRAGRR